MVQEHKRCLRPVPQGPHRVPVLVSYVETKTHNAHQRYHRRRCRSTKKGDRSGPIISVPDRIERGAMSIGVLLGGCGYYDGSDVQETVFTLLAVESSGERAILVAPDAAQERTVDHLSGEEIAETRNVLRESARLARRPIRRLQEIRHDELEALLIPGG